MLEFYSIAETYEISEEIGSGGGGTVYKAYHKRLQKEVVIKKIHEEVQDIVNRRAEADILKNLRHSYLPQVFDFLEINCNVYTVMDYIPGKSFQQLLDEGQTFSQKQVIKWAKQLAEALEYLHNQTPPIIHSDIKPANIMLTPKGDICLIDFNISSVFENSGAQPIGFSDGYSPPEQYPESVRRRKIESIKVVRSQEIMKESLIEATSKETTSKETTSKEVSLKEATSSEERRDGKDTELVKTHADTIETGFYRDIQNIEERTEYYDRENQDVVERTEYFNRDNRNVEERTEYFDRDNQNSEEKTEYFKRESISLNEKTELCKREYLEDIEKTEYFNSNKPRESAGTEYYVRKVEGHNTDAALANQEVAVSTTTEKVRIDERSDLYSLGATLYHLLTGEKPEISFLGVTPICTKEVKLSDGISYVITKAMQPVAGKRFQTVSKLRTTLNQLGKLDKRYKRFMLQQELVAILVLILFALSVVSIHFGRETMWQETIDCYNNYIEESMRLRETKDYDSFEEVYELAVKLIPDNIAAFYQKALSLFEQDLYQETINYIETDILPNYSGSREDEMKGDIYFILGNCYFELEEFEKSIVSFSDAVHSYSSNSEYYRDYAIALARVSQTKEASEVLEKALAKGLTEDNIYLVKGEIDLANGKYESAISNFMKCIQETKSDYIKYRSYVMCSKTYEKAGNQIERGQLKNIELLEQAKVKLPIDMTMIVNARLADAYIEYGTITQDKNYYVRAIEIFKIVESMGWDTYYTHNNVALLYRQLGDLEKAFAELNYMLEEYGENYNTYKRLAYLETDIQKAKENLDRDYTNFYQYYVKAVDLYRETAINNKNDTEMEYLNRVYQELVEGNWL